MIISSLGWGVCQNAPYTRELNFEELRVLKVFARELGIELPQGISAEIRYAPCNSSIRLRWHSPLGDVGFLVGAPASVEMLKVFSQGVRKPLPLGESGRQWIMRADEICATKTEGARLVWLNEQIELKNKRTERELYIQDLEKEAFLEPGVIQWMHSADEAILKLQGDGFFQEMRHKLSDYWDSIEKNPNGAQIHKLVLAQWKGEVYGVIDEIDQMDRSCLLNGSIPDFLEMAQGLIKEVQQAPRLNYSLSIPGIGHLLYAYIKLQIRCVGWFVICHKIQIVLHELKGMAEDKGDVDLANYISGFFEPCPRHAEYLIDCFYAGQEPEDEGSSILQEVRLAEQRKLDLHKRVDK